jgi:TerC family integral membrane protein
VLFWGIIGAVIARGAFIAAGVAMIQHFHYAMYVLGAFLVYSAIKILVQKEDQIDPSKNIVLRLFRRLVPTTAQYHGAKFITRIDGRWLATPLLAVLVVVDAADVVFAVDSIPAVFGVTTDLFIVLTVQHLRHPRPALAVLLLAALVRKLRFLKLGVAVILAFIGVKILLESVYHMPDPALARRARGHPRGHHGGLAAVPRARRRRLIRAVGGRAPAGCGAPGPGRRSRARRAHTPGGRRTPARTTPQGSTTRAWP